VRLDDGTHRVDDDAKQGAHSAQAAEIDPVDDSNDWAPTPSALSALRCPTCGEPSFDGDRCQACREAAALKRQDSNALAGSDTMASANAQPVEDVLAPALAASTTIAPSQDWSDKTTSAIAEAQQTLSEAVASPSNEKRAAAPGQTLDTETLTSTEVLPKRAKPLAVQTETVRRPALVTKRPAVQVKPERRHLPIALAAIGVVVATIGAGAYWLRLHEKSAIARDEQLASIVATEAATEVTDAEARALPVDQPPAPTPAGQDRNPTPARERAGAPTASDSPKSTTAASREGSAPSRPKPATSARPSRIRAPTAVADKPVRTQVSTREVPAVAVPKPAAVVPAPPAAVAETVSTAAIPPSAVGPFFEIRDVTESPRIATRAEPRLPAELKGRSIKEVVVVRALVSQNGHPSRISLLRRSKAGTQVDDVILSSVNEWTFSPARKKGEAVSCWFNFAVQVGGPN
jgi:hypothetical protein